MKILVVDDELKMRRVLQMALEEDGYSVVLAKNGKEAVKKISEIPFRLVIADMKMPVMDGMELLRKIEKLNENLPVIMMTAYGTVATAVEAMKQGAYDYILKPFDIEEMKLIVSRAISVERLVREKTFQQEELRARYGFNNIIGISSQIRKVCEAIRKVADVKSTVLICGESGTGKELVAHAIHFAGERSERPFIAVNCAALSETLLESELFGHVKGAFTGAHADRQGRFELADGGSLFLDEVSAMSPALQASLLRIIETKEFEKVGGTRTIQSDVRIIAATNTDLKKLIQKGLFREDLYYRLNVVPILLPPLRERRDDIPILARHFLSLYSAELGKRIKEISPPAMNLLSGYGWPGNVRELENVIERAVVLVEGDTLGEKDIPLDLSFGKVDNTPTGPARNLSYQEAKKEVIESFERAFFAKVIEAAGGNITQAAKLTEMDRKNLYEKLKKLNIRCG
jgi:two-component system NtrC family response regulator